MTFFRHRHGRRYAHRADPCWNSPCGLQSSCTPVQGKYRCIPIPDPCSGLRCAADEDCVVDQGQAYCQKKITSCPENESRQECGSLCEGLCLATLLGNLTCAVESVCSFPACACNKGFYRDAFGKCVVEHECFPDMRCFASPPPCKETEGCVVERGQVICVPTVTQPCGRNEVYNDCGNFCEPTCENAFGREKACAKVCSIPACVCERGFYRKNGRCVPARQCRRTVGNLPRAVVMKKDLMTSYGDEPFVA